MSRNKSYVVTVAVAGVVFVEVNAVSEAEARDLAPDMTIWADAERRVFRSVDVHRVDARRDVLRIADAFTPPDPFSRKV